MDDIVALAFNDDENIILNIAEAAVQLAAPLIEENMMPQERGEVNRNLNYFEEVIPRYTNQQFREHFRMSRDTFNVLLNHIRRVHQNPNEHIPLRKKVLATIWLLSKHESFLACEDRFGIAQSSLFKIFNEVVDNLCQLAHEFIVWPNQESFQESVNVFQIRSRGIPGVIGAIDGCHIAIQQPVGNAFDYYNRKGFHSVILQGVCNERAIFIDISVGSPGRMHDARVFRLSPLYERLTSRDNFLPPFYHLIGDSAFPLLPSLMKPYQDNGHLTRDQQIYIKLSSIRFIIERAFGLLKGKWRRLKYLEVNQPETASRIILACCFTQFLIIAQ